MQASLRRGGQQGNSLAVSQLLQKQMAALKSQQGAQQLQAAVNSMRSQNSQKTPTHRSSKLVTTPSHATVGSSSAPTFVCEICDASVQEKEKYLQHLQVILRNVSISISKPIIKYLKHHIFRLLISRWLEKCCRTCRKELHWHVLDAVTDSGLMKGWSGTW